MKNLSTKTNMYTDKRLYIIYDERTAMGNTGDARVMVTCDSVKECMTYAGDFGGHCAVYSYAKKGNELIGERFEFVLSSNPTTKKGKQ